MPAFLALLLLAATSIDPRLDEPLRILADAHDADGRPLGEPYARMPDELGLTLDVGELPIGASGQYDSGRRTLTIAEAALTEDPRFLATVLAHELRHAADLDQVALGLQDSNCLDLEARGFEAQAQIARALWPDELPGGTLRERGLAGVVRMYEAGGIDAIREALAGDERYREWCQSGAHARNDRLARRPSADR